MLTACKTIRLKDENVNMSIPNTHYINVHLFTVLYVLLSPWEVGCRNRNTAHIRLVLFHYLLPQLVVTKLLTETPTSQV